MSCTACAPGTAPNCGVYKDGKGAAYAEADVSAAALCPMGSTMAPACYGCAVGFSTVGAARRKGVVSEADGLDHM